VEDALRRPRSGDLKLIETFRRDPDGGFVRLPAHLARLLGTAAALRVPLDPDAVEVALAAVTGDGPLRVRLTVTLAGAVAAEAAPLAPNPPEWIVTIADRRLASNDPWLRHKTSRRAAHDAARAALPAGVDEALLANERGEIAEGTITSVFADFGGGLLSPPVASGLLPGVLRAELLARGDCREAVIPAAALADARGLFVGNSLRGLIPARLRASAVT
jgi:4-amino-4-deoxychorismate lyase